MAYHLDASITDTDIASGIVNPACVLFKYAPVGSDPLDADLTFTWLLGCNSGQSHPYVTGQCCTDAADANSCQNVKIPCSVNMISLAAKLTSSEYKSFGSAIKSAFLIGQSVTRRQSRNTALGLIPTGPTSAPETDSLGGYVWKDRNNSFTKYWRCCNPAHCDYVINDVPSAHRLFFMVLGIIGGIAAALKGAGWGMMYAARYGHGYCFSNHARVATLHSVDDCKDGENLDHLK